MKTSGLILCALFAGCLIITACSQTTQLSRFQFTPNISSTGDRGGSPLGYRVLHNFGADHDGDYPIAGLVDGGGALYGTTSGGGLYGPGTVFSVTTSGAEKVLHSFGATKTSGRVPYAGLIYVNGTLYGTTAEGGAFGDGTLFSITADGSEKVLHNFGNGNDGKYPSSGLIAVNGTLYGTTDQGGTSSCFPSEGCGTVFSVTTGRKEKVLHSFGKGQDGSFPVAALIDIGGTFYGTTGYGGEYGAGKYGTVFSITADGHEKVIHSFGEGHDGALPEADLVYLNGKIYGTTWYGGAQTWGTIFSITRSGSEKVLHSFGKGTDGREPYGGLTDVGGTLYGTTIGGGTNYCPGASGCGIVYSITTSGTEKVLHNFGKGTDGNGPLGNLVYKDGRLFGTTQAGGIYANKQVIGGTAFSMMP